ncbi:hypothetical protein Hanom_Chr10g00952451 [Helianthus anomalus]
MMYVEIQQCTESHLYDLVFLNFIQAVNQHNQIIRRRLHFKFWPAKRLIFFRLK